MTVFITGATGFIGSRFLELTKNDPRFQKIYCLCRKEQSFSSKINVINGSLEELAYMQPIKADVCLHLAAVTDSANAGKKEMFKTNVEGTDKVIEFCKKSGIPRIVFLSSVNVYLKKKYTYALSKIAAEEAIEKSGLKYSNLRCSLVYGSGCPSFKKILRFADCFHLIPVLGKGNSYKQPIYIDEACNEIIKYTLSPSIENGTYDLYGKTKMTYNEMVRSIIAVNNRKALMVHLPVYPFILVSEYCYKHNLSFPIYPEQISHMCEDQYSKTDFNTDHLDDFHNNLLKYTQ